MKKKSGIIFIIVFLIASILGVVSMYTPKPKSGSGQEFSTENAKEHIKEIAKEPHSIYDVEALARVRQYIISEIEELGLKPEVFTYSNVKDRNDNVVDMNNIFTKIDGKDGENGSYILLATHYDSSPKKRAGEEEGSLGAADAGYGISTILEILRIIKESGKPLENGIKVLITDGEEMGLLGAKEEMNNNFDLYKNVSYVINLEARGVKGPALMFETSANNKKVIDLYKKANLPVSYSLAADVYSKMPNGSDFTEFKNKGLQGINFAVLNSLDYYHTPRDNYDNVSDTSVQHYGEQVLPIVQEFVYNPEYNNIDYFKDTKGSIFFTLLPNVFINYSTTIGTILALVAIIILAFVLFKNKNNLKEILKWTGFWFAGTIIALISGLGISFIVSKVTGVAFKLTYMPKIKFAGIITFIAIVILALLLNIAIKKLAVREESKINVILGSAIYNTVLLIVFNFALPGGSYLFLWPVLMLLVAMILIGKGIKKEIVIIPVALVVIMFIPVVYNIYIALTIGALGVVLLLAIIALSTVISVKNYIV